MKRTTRLKKGFSSILAVIFVTLFSVLAISFTAMSNMNVQMSQNHRDLARAQAAAESGLEYVKYLIKAYTPPTSAYSMYNTVSETEARDTFIAFAIHVETLLGVGSVSWDLNNLVLRVPANGGIALTTGGASSQFTLVCEFEGDPHNMVVTSTGAQDGIERQVRLKFPIKKDAQVMDYAIASRGRMWLTGDTRIYGDIFSSWDRPDISPFNMTNLSRVEGTINTVLARSAMDAYGYQMETLDQNGDPIDIYGNPLGTNYTDRYYGSSDEVQAYHEGINYEVPFHNMPGMDLSDYDTDGYLSGLSDIPTSGDRVVEYFPHVTGDFSTPSNSWSRYLNRHVYENQTLTNARLPSNRNALFRNCTFEGVLYVDCAKSATSYYNNVRFENCTFNGVIVSDTPQTFKWRENCLYFTGTATFQNSSSVQEATVLAPHFNVNMGNTDPTGGDNNKLTGAIVGGIVDVRGNANIKGTIISMCDTTQWSSGYVTNIGATLGDGGSETTTPGDVGTIEIVPEEDKMLPSGIKTPVIIGTADGDSYVEL